MPRAQDDDHLSATRGEAGTGKPPSGKAQDDELVMNLVELALSQPLDSREAYLRSACQDDPELFNQVWDYVQWDRHMQDFLLNPLHPTLREHQFQPGELLAGTDDPRFQHAWKMASADTFRPVA